MAAAQQPLSPHRAKPYPLPVPDRRQPHVGGLFAGFLEEGCANEGHSLARTGGLGRGGIARIQPQWGGPWRLIQKEDPARGRGLRRVPDKFPTGIRCHKDLRVCSVTWERTAPCAGREGRGTTPVERSLNAANDSTTDHPLHPPQKHVRPSQDGQRSQDGRRAQQESPQRTV